MCERINCIRIDWEFEQARMFIHESDVWSLPLGLYLNVVERFAIPDHQEISSWNVRPW
jgi:hypothetical protein